MADISDLQSRISSLVDQDVDAPTAGGDDWNLRLKYLNRSQNKWEQTSSWKELYKESNSKISTATGNATIAMPSDFKKLAGYPKICDGTTTIEYPEIDPMKRFQYDDSEEYCYLLGNLNEGYKLVVNPASLVSGASVFAPYWASGGTLASPADKSMCPDPEYLVAESIAQLWESREDPRFPEMKAEADRRLAQMLENSNVRGYGYDNKVDMPEDTKYAFRWGK